MRLRQVGPGAGRLEPGPLNAITDVDGVQVGHARVVDGGLETGLTAVLPYPIGAGKGKLFAGRWAVDGGETMSGLGVTEDFGTFSSPVVLAPAPAAGRVYEALIRHGLERDRGLSTVAGWPPVVVGVDDSGWNEAQRTYRALGEEQVEQALRGASGGPVVEGSAGIGAGLVAFGLRGGVGTASRRVGDYVAGALVAVNGGLSGQLRVDGFAVDTPPAGQGHPQNFAAVVALDAPLHPRQLERLAARAALGLVRAGLLSPATREGLVFSFSTAGSGGEEGPLELVDMVGEEALYPLFEAGAEACEEAVLNALLAAGPAGRLQVLEPQALRRWREGRR